MFVWLLIMLFVLEVLVLLLVDVCVGIWLLVLLLLSILVGCYMCSSRMMEVVEMSEVMMLVSGMEM